MLIGRSTGILSFFLDCPSSTSWGPLKGTESSFKFPCLSRTVKLALFYSIAVIANIKRGHWSFLNAVSVQPADLCLHFYGCVYETGVSKCWDDPSYFLGIVSLNTAMF